MIGTINWKNKNGKKMETNDLDATIKHMESSGAVRIVAKKKTTKVVDGKVAAENKQTDVPVNIKS